MSKENYVSPVMDVVELEDDVILTSGPMSACSLVCPTDGMSISPGGSGGVISGGSSGAVSGGSPCVSPVISSGSTSGGNAWDSPGNQGTGLYCPLDNGTCLANIAPGIP